jgi:hypothetical protein
MYVNSDVNIYVGELTGLCTVIGIDCAAVRNLRTVAGGSGNKEAVWNS